MVPCVHSVLSLRSAWFPIMKKNSKTKIKLAKQKVAIAAPNHTQAKKMCWGVGEKRELSMENKYKIKTNAGSCYKRLLLGVRRHSMEFATCAVENWKTKIRNSRMLQYKEVQI